jgi:Protein of unknown function (DUF1566)
VCLVVAASTDAQKSPIRPNSAGVAVAAPPVEEKCEAFKTWLPNTPEPTNEYHPPDEDCPFYQAAWQHFLYATRPAVETSGRITPLDSLLKAPVPAFLGYKSVEEIFGRGSAPQFAKRTDGRLSLAPRDTESPNSDGPTIDSGVRQAGLRGILIDQNGHPVYYAIHVNENFQKFVNENRLTTSALLKNAPANLAFTKGVVELKSAWQIVDDENHPPKDYMTVKASVPTLTLVKGKIQEDPRHTRNVTVKLLALHVVFVLQGHPEFIWSTFEHVDSQGKRDVAPPAKSAPPELPESQPARVPIENADGHFSVYKSGTISSDANKPLSRFDFNEETQTFVTKSAGKPDTPLQTSIYRVFPASKADPNEPEDGAVVAINKNMEALFQTSHLDENDKRGHYTLVGAVWLNHPDQSFNLDSTFTKGKDTVAAANGKPESIFAGEDRLSGVAMESFTQDSAFNNCFRCHDTGKVTNDLTGKLLLNPKKLNVSHVLSKFLSEFGDEPPIVTTVDPKAAEGSSGAPAPAALPTPVRTVQPHTQSTGRMWAKKDNGSDVTQPQALDYCKNLGLDGYRDWRLPSIGELASIYDRSANVGQGQYHIKYGIKLTGVQWSSSPGESSGKAWLLSFSGGELSIGEGSSFLRRALCVRSAGEPHAAERTTPPPVRSTELTWTKQDNGSDVTQQQALNYCRSSLEGFKDWRLPTIDELQSIYDPSANENGRHIKGGIKLTGAQWSSSPGESSGEAWVFLFSLGHRLSDDVGSSYVTRALCVRRAGE